MITPDDDMKRNRNRIIIPYTYRNKIVGNTSRYCDDQSPKYINEQQTGYVFGIDLQKPEWQICILVEGIFDALSIGGCAYLHNTISVEQAQLLATLNRRIIVCPDQDKAGLAVTDRALELGYSVSIPRWDTDVKDVNDATRKYGALATVLSIIESATTSPIVIKMRKREFKI
jgi:DNA primase